MENEKKITYIKGTYIWSFDKNYETKIKMIKSINGNIKLQNMTIFKDDNEFILKPRCIINDPFDEDNSILLSCDIIDLQNKCNNYDSRMGFLKQMENFGNKIKKNNTKINFQQKFKFKNTNINITEVINKLIKYCLSTNIELDEIDYTDQTIIVSNKLTNILSACDEIYFIRYIFDKLCKNNKYEYDIIDKLNYKFIDDLTINDNGLNIINEYLKKLELKHSSIKKNELHESCHEKFSISNQINKDCIFIPKSVNSNKKGYFIDQRFVGNTDPYTIIFSNINEIYS